MALATKEALRKPGFLFAGKAGSFVTYEISSWYEGGRENGA
jgi:hypothetical protein